MTLYSYDVFDTLISRATATPCGIFLLMQSRIELGEFAQHSFSFDVTRLKDFRNLRLEAERRARRLATKEDVTLDEIYQQLKATTGVADETLMALQELELAIEVDNCRAVPETVSAIEQRLDEGQKVVLISDMYLGRDRILKLIDGVAPRIARECTLYVSSDVGFTKHSGKLFQFVCDKEAIAVDHLFHTGDNPKADCQSAQKIGAISVHYKTAMPTSWEKICVDSLLGQSAGGGGRLHRLENRSLPYCFGYSLAGPIFGPFIAWVVREALRKNLSALGFVARDGYLLMRLAEILAQHLDASHLRFKYVSGSRQAWHIASLTGSDDDIEWVFKSQRKLTLRKVAARLGIEIESFRSLLASEAIPLDKLDDAITLRSRVAIERVLRRESGRKAMADVGRRQSSLLLRYLRDLGLLDRNEKSALVDVGWNGTMQQKLNSLLFRQEERSVIAYYFALKNPGSDTAVSFSETNGRSCFSAKTIERVAVLFEMLASACHGSTIAYQESPNGDVEPVLDDQGDLLRAWGYEDLVDGACQFVADNVETVIRPESHVESLRFAQSYITFMKQGDICEAFAEKIGGYPFNPDQDSYGSAELAPARTLSDGVRFVFGSEKIRNSITMWSHGTAKRSRGLSRFVFSPGIQSLGSIASPRRLIDTIPLEFKANLKRRLPASVRIAVERYLFG
jgi:FMN phosphatase YigB (HAD superfamily)